MFQEELTLGSFLFRLHDDVQFSKISYKNVISLFVRDLTRNNTLLQ